MTGAHVPIEARREGERFVDRCHFSKTGWAHWVFDSWGGYCTCDPAPAPVSNPTPPVAGSGAEG